MKSNSDQGSQQTIELCGRTFSVSAVCIFVDMITPDELEVQCLLGTVEMLTGQTYMYGLFSVLPSTVKWSPVLLEGSPPRQLCPH